MREEQVMRIVTQHFEAYNAKDIDALMDTVAEGATAFFPVAGKPLEGKAAIRKFFEKLFTDMPDSNLTMEETFVKEDKAVTQWRETGTFKGKPFVNYEAVFFQIGTDRISHIRVYHDVGALASQVNRVFRFLLSRFRKREGFQ